MLRLDNSWISWTCNLYCLVLNQSCLTLIPESCCSFPSYPRPTFCRLPWIRWFWILTDWTYPITCSSGGCVRMCVSVLELTWSGSSPPGQPVALWWWGWPAPACNGPGRGREAADGSGPYTPAGHRPPPSTLSASRLLCPAAGQCGRWCVGQTSKTWWLLGRGARPCTEEQQRRESKTGGWKSPQTVRESGRNAKKKNGTNSFK